VKPESFQKKYPRHFWALQNMEEGKFKQSLWVSYETGKLTQNMRTALWRKADELEAKRRDHKEAPAINVFIAGMSVTITTIKETEVVKHTGAVPVPVERVQFQTPEGWRGWVDFPFGDPSPLLRKLKNRSTDCVTIGGTIVWRRPEIAIISHTDFTAEEM